MCFVRKAGFGLMLACAPMLSVGCASLSPKLSAFPSAARHRADAQYQMARQAEQQGQFEKARDLYASLQQQSPQIATYAHRMGIVCTRLGDHATATKYFEHARGLDPKNATLLTDMGYAAFLQQDHARAEALLTEAVRLAPTDPRAVNNLAMAIGCQGRDEESLAMFRRANSESQSLGNLAYIHAQRGETERAIDGYRRAAALDPQNDGAAKALAHLSTQRDLDSSPKEVAASSTPVASAATATSQLAATAEPPLRHASEFEQPIIRQTVSQTLAGRPRDRLTDEELPFFEDETPERRPVITSARDANSSGEGFEAPIITPYEDVAAPSVVNHQSERSHETQQDDEVIASPLTARSEPPAELVDDAGPAPAPPKHPIEEDELAHVFDDDENRVATELPDTEELTGLEWARDEQAQLAASASTQADSPASSNGGFKGFCPVVVRDERRLVAVSDQFWCEYQSQTYQFSSAEALARFQDHPERYAPAAGGLDVVAVRQGQDVANGSLDFAVWYRHRLHMFSNAENLAAFRAGPRQFASVP